LWLNQHYLKTLEPEDIATRLVPFLEKRGFTVQGDPRLMRIVLALRERTHTLDEMAKMASVYFSQGVQVEEKAAAKHLGPDSRPALEQLKGALADVSPWEVEGLDAAVKTVAEALKLGMGKVAQPLRVAVTGTTVSPGIGETLALVGRDETLRRIDAVLGGGR
jgi:glutamyl-tRNA synthetase